MNGWGEPSRRWLNLRRTRKPPLSCRRAARVRRSAPPQRRERPRLWARWASTTARKPSRLGGASSAGDGCGHPRAAPSRRDRPERVGAEPACRLGTVEGEDLPAAARFDLQRPIIAPSWASTSVGVPGVSRRRRLALSVKIQDPHVVGLAGRLIPAASSRASIFSVAVHGSAADRRRRPWAPSVRPLAFVAADGHVAGAVASKSSSDDQRVGQIVDRRAEGNLRTGQSQARPYTAGMSSATRGPEHATSLSSP